MMKSSMFPPHPPHIIYVIRATSPSPFFTVLPLVLYSAHAEDKKIKKREKKGNREGLIARCVVFAKISV